MDLSGFLKLNTDVYACLKRLTNLLKFLRFAASLVGDLQREVRVRAGITDGLFRHASLLFGILQLSLDVRELRELCQRLLLMVVDILLEICKWERYSLSLPACECYQSAS